MKKILLKENYHKGVETSFYCAFRKLQESFSKDSLEEVGLEANTEILRDLLQGGDITTATVKETLTSQLLGGKQLPIIRRGNERLFDQLLEGFEDLRASVYKSMSEFRFVPAECFYVDTDGMVCIDAKGENLIREKSNLYIDKTEQIEVFDAANAVLKAIEDLENLTRRYKCGAIGRNGALTIVNGQLVLNHGVIHECHPEGAWVAAR